jgi:hypothetical protein
VGDARGFFVKGFERDAADAAQRSSMTVAAGSHAGIAVGWPMRVSRRHPLYRSMRRARKIRARLGASPSLGDALPTKPKGMHTTTYRRLMAQAQSAEAALVVATEKRFGCI